MTYREAVARITGLRGGEMAGMRPGLDRIEALLAAIGNPERSMTLAQVAGTNGKGSVSAMLAAMVQATGRRVGLYSSPISSTSASASRWTAGRFPRPISPTEWTPWARSSPGSTPPCSRR